MIHNKIKGNNMSFGKKMLEKLLEEKDLSWYLDNDGKEQKLYAYSQLGTI